MCFVFEKLVTEIWLIFTSFTSQGSISAKKVLKLKSLELNWFVETMMFIALYGWYWLSFRFLKFKLGGKDTKGGGEKISQKKKILLKNTLTFVLRIHENFARTTFLQISFYGINETLFTLIKVRMFRSPTLCHFPIKIKKLIIEVLINQLHKLKGAQDGATRKR